MRNKLTKITALLLALAAVAAAEESDSAKTDTPKTDTVVMQKRYSLRAGFNTSSISGFRSGFGFQIGAALEMPLSKIDISGENFYLGIEPSAFFVTKNGKGSYLYSYLYSYSRTIDAYYIQAPVPFTFKKIFSSNFSGHLDLGPYIALGLFGTDEYHNTSTSAFDRLDRIDMGIYYGASADIQKKYFLGAHVSHGFTEGGIYSFYMNAGYNF